MMGVVGFVIEDASTVYSKFTAVAEAGKWARSVKQQHLTRSRPFSLPPQLFFFVVLNKIINLSTV
jgi:hypothetical protein